MKRKRVLNGSFKTVMLIVVVLFSAFSVFSFERAAASPGSSYSYGFTVNVEGFTDVEVNYSSTDTSGSSWLIVPKFSTWNYTYSPSNAVVQGRTVPTTDVGFEDMYFYEAFSFSFDSPSSSTFQLTVQFDFENGALIIDDRGVFFSPQMGYQQTASTTATAKVLFDSHLTVNTAKAIAIGQRTYFPSEVDSHRVAFNLPRNDNALRLQIEFATSVASKTTTLTSQNGVFDFTTPTRYASYALNLLNVYNSIYDNYTRLFNVTLDAPLGVQFFLPEFDELLSLGGFVPFSGSVAGEINVNIFFIRAVNGTIQTIAAHELVHHFLIKAGISPSDFLWLHEGMAQYVSVNFVEKLGYEGAAQEKENLEQGSTQLIQLLDGEKFGFLQEWSPSSAPADVGNYYVAAYYVVSRIAMDYDGFEFYRHFFELINGVRVADIDTIALYLSRAANASVALTLQEWGFSVFDLYTSPEIRDKIVEAQEALAAVSPVFQPYRSLAEFFYRQALTDFKQGDTQSGSNFLQLAITTANLSPALTILTVLAVLAVIAYVLYRRSKRPKPQPAVLPPPPPEIFPQTV